MGWLLTKNVDFFPNDPHADFWFICEGIFLYSFYQIGILIKKLKLIEREIAIIPEVILLLIFGVILFFTFDLNQGPWKVTQKVPVVLINILQHGNPFYFIISALSGFFFIIFLARLTPPNKALLFVGRNTLILMGLNGFFFHFLNWKIINLIDIPNTLFLSIIYSFSLTVLSLLVCVPVILLFNTYIPQHIGRPKAKEPLWSNFN